MELFNKHLDIYIKKDGLHKIDDINEREKRVTYYQSWNKDKMRKMTEEDLFEYIAKLWAMLIWGNKQYYVDKLLQDNGMDKFKNNLANLAWGELPAEERWDDFRKNIKGFGPAMMSEILCHVHPNELMIWNRRAYVALEYLGAKELPTHNYQLTGKTYKRLSNASLELLKEMKKIIPDATLLTLDYFFWDELQVEDNLSKITRKKAEIDEKEIQKADSTTSQFIHNEIRDKLSEIGERLGFKTKTEVPISEGAKVDTIWEWTIGNMGRIIYVFEVQNKGSVDSLIMNLLKALNNPAVQGIVAVSDKKQIEQIKNEAAGVKGIAEKLRYWDYEEVLEVHEHLEVVNEKINLLKLIPEEF